MILTNRTSSNTLAFMIRGHFMNSCFADATNANLDSIVICGDLKIILSKYKLENRAAMPYINI